MSQQRQQISNKQSHHAPHHHHQQQQAVSLHGAARFRIERELADTLQGRIYAGTDLVTQKQVVIKEAWRQLVHSGRSRKGHRVPEDFVKERQLIMTLTNLPNCTEGIVQGIDQWDDEHCYYYAMEYCQGELFDYISKTHTQTEYRKFVESEANKEQIPMRKPNQWVKNVAKMFKQICVAVHYLHRNNYCHLDLSLENTMIYDVEKLKIKIIDFGLMRKFNGKDFSFHGRVGKLQYMCPEAYARQVYDAKAADVYCLGVMLFMMLIGAPPYQAPQPQNAAFNYFISGRIGDVLKHWKRLRLITVDALDLLNKIIRYENTRITLDEILQHSFFEGCDDFGSGQIHRRLNINRNEIEQKQNDPQYVLSSPSAVDETTQQLSGMSLEEDIVNNQIQMPQKQKTNASDEGVDMQISDGDEDSDVIPYHQPQQHPGHQPQHHHQHQRQQHEHQPEIKQQKPLQHDENKENDNHNKLISNSNNNSNNGNMWCDLLLKAWGLEEISGILLATGWSQPQQWYKLDENALKYEIGLDAQQAKKFMQKYNAEFSKKNAQKIQNTHQHKQPAVKPPIQQQMSMSPHPQQNAQQPRQQQPQQQQPAQYQQQPQQTQYQQQQQQQQYQQPYYQQQQPQQPQQQQYNNQAYQNPQQTQNQFNHQQYAQQYAQNQQYLQQQQYAAQQYYNNNTPQPAYAPPNNNNNNINTNNNHNNINNIHGHHHQYNAPNYQYQNDPNQNYKSAQQFVNYNNYDQISHKQNNKVCGLRQ